MKLRYILPTLLALFLLGAPILSPAQPGGALQAINPMTRDLGALITHTARVGTATNLASADQSGFNVSRVICVQNISTFNVAPSAIFSIQNKDAASGNYYTLISSTAQTSTSTVPLQAGAGLVNVANQSSATTIARTWRVVTTLAGSSTMTITGTIGCSVQ